MLFFDALLDPICSFVFFSRSEDSPETLTELSQLHAASTTSGNDLSFHKTKLTGVSVAVCLYITFT